MGTRLHLVGVVAVETAGVPSDPVELISESGVLVLGDAVVDAVVVGGVAPGFGDLARDVFAREVATGRAVTVTGVALEGGRRARGVDGAAPQKRACPVPRPVRYPEHPLLACGSKPESCSRGRLRTDPQEESR